ncbi:MAG: hypothetical protein AB7K04_15740, partial [Pseudorhodoplanes sp.]
RPESETEGRPAVRIPAIELEQAVAVCLASALDEPMSLVTRLGIDVSAMALNGLFERAEALATDLRRRDKRPLQELVERVDVLDDAIRVECDAAALAARVLPGSAVRAGVTLMLSSEVELQRTGMAMRLVQTSGAGVTTAASPMAIKLILKARRWWHILRTEQISIADLARRENATRSYMCRIVRLAFLAPTVVDAIIAGTARAGVGPRVISAAGGIEPSWADQAAMFLPDSGHRRLDGEAGYGLAPTIAAVSAL